MEQPPPLSEHYSTEASGRAANRAIYGLAAAHGWLMPRGRPSAEAADEAEVESVLKSAAVRPLPGQP